MLESTVGLGISLAIFAQTVIASGNPLLLAVVSLLCLDGAMCLLICLGTLADVYKESKRTLETTKTDLSDIDNIHLWRWNRRFLRYIGVIKMRFCGSNYVDGLTPLNCLSHGVHIGVQILLLRPR